MAQDNDFETNRQAQPSAHMHSSDENSDAKAFALEKARAILKNPELHVDLDNPDPAKGTYSVEQLTNLWGWYKQEMHKNIKNYEEVLQKPLEREEREELESLAKRLGWVSDQPTGREHLQSHAWKYKKLKDYELRKKAAKYKTPEEKADYLARHGAPLDVVPADEITGTPAAAAAAHEAEFRQEQAELDAFLEQEEQEEQYPRYSEDSDWWPGWDNVQYKDLPSQPFLQALIEMLQAKKAESGAQQAAKSSQATVDMNNPALWRALPVELDPFLLKRPDQGTYKLLAGDTFINDNGTGKGTSSDTKKVFVVTVVAVLGFSLYRWIRRRVSRRSLPKAEPTS